MARRVLPDLSDQPQIKIRLHHTRVDNSTKETDRERGVKWGNLSPVVYLSIVEVFDYMREHGTTHKLEP